MTTEEIKQTEKITADEQTPALEKILEGCNSIHKINKHALFTIGLLSAPFIVAYSMYHVGKSTVNGALDVARKHVILTAVAATGLGMYLTTTDTYKNIDNKLHLTRTAYTTQYASQGQVEQLESSVQKLESQLKTYNMKK